MKPDCSRTAKHLPHPQLAEQGCGIKEKPMADPAGQGQVWLWLKSEEGSALLMARGKELQRRWEGPQSAGRARKGTEGDQMDRDIKQPERGNAISAAPRHQGIARKSSISAEVVPVQLIKAVCCCKPVELNNCEAAPWS